MKYNYPQQGRSFWGNQTDNNYGFGSSNIESNIEQHPAMNTTPAPIEPMQNLTSQIQSSASWSNGINNMPENNNSTVQSINTYKPINVGYNIGQKVGEFAADTKLAYDYWQKMNQTGAKLVNTLGPGAGADIDNYYHPLLQCELAKIGQQSRNNGIALGYAKEYLMDYPIKRFWQHKSHDEIMKDSRKYLQNNLYGSNLGYNNSNQSCEDLLDDQRTPNMRKLGIK